MTFYKSHLILLLAVCQILYQMAYYYFFSLVRQYSGRFSDHGSSFFNSSSLGEYYGAAEPPVRCGESHLSGLTEPPHFVY
ncbi:MAG: hypothetical protein ACLRIQ_24815 [Blautia wexlerae]